MVVAGGLGVVDLEGDVAVAGAEVVGGGVPVVGQLEHGGLGLGAVADEREGEAAVRVVAAAQQLHAEHVGVEGERALQVADPEHGVEDAHGGYFLPAGFDVIVDGAPAPGPVAAGAGVVAGAVAGGALPPAAARMAASMKESCAAICVIS
jgi:hypothetical protein